MTEPIVKVADLIPGPRAELPAVAPQALAPGAFWREHVLRHQPVVLRGAVAEWPALQRWSTPGYLEDRCDGERVRWSRTFNPEPAAFYFRGVAKEAGLAETLQRMRQAADDETHSIPAMKVPDQWAGDLGLHLFLDREHDRPPRRYARRRLFVYRNASTEWHYHPTDETLTTQLLGTKRVSLFRPPASGWRAYGEPIGNNFHHLACRRHFFPEPSPVLQYEATLRPGDVLYIPPFWWHGIDAADSSLGITLAHCFRTPLRRFGAWREPAVRDMLRETLRGRGMSLPRTLSLVAFSALARSLARETW